MFPLIWFLTSAREQGVVLPVIPPKTGKRVSHGASVPDMGHTAAPSPRSERFHVRSSLLATHCPADHLRKPQHVGHLWSHGDDGIAKWTVFCPLSLSAAIRGWLERPQVLLVGSVWGMLGGIHLLSLKLCQSWESHQKKTLLPL